ncbi:EAL domain-containing protein [Hyphomicrobium sp. NDB2Meth4]|uniref:putative bifunctional diguanylate cyclase/phosphodiesterase n=1 Tax=Hyphomicrobium sp. NDB2Meth4 TaxID=1892846 RepID=UPI0009309DC3|nr:EAL domain-containing protein [Hyphomicrobium sp. NDB2Meth4]
MSDGETKNAQGGVRAEQNSNRRAIVDAIFLALACVTAWIVIERTDVCTRFFAYVAAHPDQELDSVILAGIFSAVGLLVFAVRRWRESRRAERFSNRLAYNDSLTELPNRRAFMEALERGARRKEPFACLLFDLDNFKQVNDLRGHLVGDQLLQVVAERLRGFMAPDILLARIGGDEFAVLLTSHMPDRAMELAHLIALRVREPMLIEGRVVQVDLSAGIARYPYDAERADAILRKADIALYRAKDSGRGLARAFTADMEEKERRRAAVADALREAIPRGEIVPHYQPLVELATGKVVGFEVLARWESPVLGTVTPSEFIPIAIETGLIGPLSQKVLERACTEAVAWPQHLPISFNIAPTQLCDPLLPLQLLAILSQTGLAPKRLEIELTEEALLASDQKTAFDVDVLKDQGITLALDDFGTGYSSLHHLRTLPFDKIKIDRSYVAKIETCEASRRMVQAIVNFAHVLGIPLLAEGVETAEQGRILTTLGCDLAQGWLYGRAVPNSALEEHFHVRRSQLSFTGLKQDQAASA